MTVLVAVLCMALPACGQSNTLAARGFALSSPDLTPDGRLDLRQANDVGGCRGRNISPALAWDHAPAGTHSFALLMFDTDAPGGGWWHWVVFDIPAGTRSLPAGAGNPAAQRLPPGTLQGRNDFGSLGYGGPCPPPGAPHHYHLMLYALRVTKLGLGMGASPGKVDAKVRAAAIAKAEVTVLYGR